MKGLFGKVLFGFVLHLFQIIGALFLIAILFFTPYRCSFSDYMHDYGITSLVIGLLAVILPFVCYRFPKTTKE